MKLNLYRAASLTTIIAMPITMISCTSRSDSSIFDDVEYFAETNYFVIPLNHDIWLASSPILKENYDQFDLGVFEKYRKSFSEVNTNFIVLQLLVQNKITLDNYLWVGVFNKSGLKLQKSDLEHEKYFELTYTINDYFDHFYNATGNMFDEGYPFTTSTASFASKIFVYLDPIPYYQFLSYDGVSKRFYSFKASSEELLFVDELENGGSSTSPWALQDLEEVYRRHSEGEMG